MQILFILGSPRKNGNSETLARLAVKPLLASGHDVDFLRLNSYDITPCQGCGGCEKTGVCIIKNDQMGEIYSRVNDADCLVVVSPVYFYAVTAQIKLCIDRFQAIWSAKYLLKKSDSRKRVGFFISCAATQGKSVFQGGLLTVKCFFDALDVDYASDLLVRGVEGSDAVKDSTSISSRATMFGKAISETLSGFEKV